jgi:hypothetical protein
LVHPSTRKEAIMSVNINRRALVAGAASAAVAIPAAAAPMPDPIFAAIEAHRAAWAALEKDCSQLSDEGTPEAEAEFYRLNDAVEVAVCTLVATQPTTMAGAVVLLRHVAEHEDKGDTVDCFEDEDDGKTKPWSYFMHQTLADALEEMKASA